MATAEETLQVVVRKRRLQGNDVVVLDLAAAHAAQQLPRFEAGAHIDVHLACGLVRQYSLCGDPAAPDHYRLGVLRDPQSRGGSQAVFDGLHEGSLLQVSRPRNHFPLDAQARHTILVGGGIGITPMIAMAYALHAAGRSFELHYRARGRDACAFTEELACSPFAERVQYHFSDAGGRLDIAARVAANGLVGTHLYVCGPVGFIEGVLEAAQQAGLPRTQLHREYFNADVDTSGGSFDVVAAASGRAVRVAEGQSIVSALASIGIKIEVSCEEGVCGTCVCTVLEGDCDHRDVYLTDEEKADNDQIMACCSRAKSSSLVLDL